MNGVVFPPYSIGRPEVSAMGLVGLGLGVRGSGRLDEHHDVFSRNGTYMPSPSCQSLVVECIGGGGGAGSRRARRPFREGAVGVQRRLTPQGVAGGDGAGRGSRDARGGRHAFHVNTPAGTGGQTSFGALCVAFGGIGGEANNLTTVGGSGGPGAPIGVGVVQPGRDGQMGEGFVGNSVTAGFTAFCAVHAAAPAAWRSGAGVCHRPGRHLHRPHSAAEHGRRRDRLASSTSLPGRSTRRRAPSGVCIVTEMIAGDGFFVEDCGGGQARVARGFSPQFQLEDRG